MLSTETVCPSVQFEIWKNQTTIPRQRVNFVIGQHYPFVIPLEEVEERAGWQQHTNDWFLQRRHSSCPTSRPLQCPPPNTLSSGERRGDGDAICLHSSSFPLWPLLRCVHRIRAAPADPNNTAAKSQRWHRTCTPSVQNATRSVSWHRGPDW